MNDSRIASLMRGWMDSALTRRSLGQGLAGGAIAAGLAEIGWDDADAKRRGKKRKNKKRKTRRGGNSGGDGDRCQFDICDGECVDFDSDRNNCGVCGRVCPGNFVCAAGFCVLSVGTRGNGADQFDDPIGVAVDADDVFYIADGNNRRIRRFGPGVTGAFGEFGEEDGQFLRPAGVAVNKGTGDLYVADIDRHRIQRFGNPATTPAFEIGFGTFGSGIEQFEVPIGLAVDESTDQIFIADSGNDRIQRVNANGFALGRFGRTGSGEGQFVRPLGIAIDRDRNVIVADAGNNRIQIVDQEGNFIRAFGSKGNGNGQFDQPVALALDATGDIYVVDRGNNRIQKFSGDGQFQRAFGGPGEAGGQFDSPFGIAIDSDGVIAVVDQGNDRVQFFVPAVLATESVNRNARPARQRSRDGFKGVAQ